MMRRIILIITISIALAGCQGPGGIPSAIPEQPETEPFFSIIYLIHGDADYIYHQDGSSKQADENVRAEARMVGEQVPSGELFVFHLQPKPGILSLFSKNHRHLEYYRNGKLLISAGYRPDINQGTFSSEAELFKKISAVSNRESTRNVLLYFGHEIPPQDGVGYHRSYPETALNYQTFANGVDRFLNGSTSDSFDLIALSTCNNGTPAMANLLQGRTQYLLASPQNLHLSHMDSQSLTLLENRDKSIQQVAESMAESTYRRLTESIQTAVTLSLYDMSEIKNYISELSTEYSSYLHGRDFRVGDDNMDCASLPFFRADQHTKGVQHWYRSARFGQNKDKLSHSGWGCQQLK